MLDALGRRFLFQLSPETAHKLSLRALATGLTGTQLPRDERLTVQKAGLTFANPLGMAAGYDKNAEVPDALLGLGFGFAEVGTVTPRAQTGNPTPRVFRLTEDAAVINRLGFNNEGHAAVRRRLTGRRKRPGIVGVNIGANKDSEDRIGDYVSGVRTFAALADYLTVNISSPNTPGLRNLQAADALSELLGRVMEARGATPGASGGPVPIFLKVAPDLNDAEISAIAKEAIGAGVDGLIVSNTTVSRTGLKSPQRGEAGGLSGKPLFARSTAVLARMRKAVGPEMAIVGVGGVDSTETAAEKIRAGADLIQLYTGMIYRGPGLPARIVRGLHDLCDRDGLASISALRDTEVDRWADKPLED